MIDKYFYIVLVSAKVRLCEAASTRSPIFLPYSLVILKILTVFVCFHMVRIPIKLYPIRTEGGVGGGGEVDIPNGFHITKLQRKRAS